MMRSLCVVNLVLLQLVLTSTASTDEQRRGLARDFFENTLLQLMYQRQLLVDGFTNATAGLNERFDEIDDTALDEQSTGETAQS